MHAKHHLPIETKVLEFNLENANNGIFQFKEIENKPSDYRGVMSSLSPVSYSLLSESFLFNETLTQHYHTLMWKHGPQAATYCGDECKLGLFCDSNYAVNEKKLECNGKQFSYIKMIDFAAGRLMGTWVEKQEE